MTWSVGVGGAWKAVTDMWVGVGGAWKRVSQISVGDGGVWKDSLAVVTVSGENITGDSLGAGVRFNADGTVDQREGVGTYTQIDAATDWVRPVGAASAVYSVRCTHISGSALDGGSDSTGVWLSLDQNLEWFITGSSQAAQLEIEISADGGATVLDSSDQYFLSTA